MNPKNRIPRFNFENPSIKTIDITLHSVNIGVGTRRLRATWTPELAQDIHAYSGIDAEAELTALLSENLAIELDREILDQLQGFVHEPPQRLGITPELTLRRHRFFEEDTLPSPHRLWTPHPIADELINVQPLPLPTGNLFYMDYVYDTGMIEEPVVYENGSWSLGHAFEGEMNIKTILEPITF